MRIHNGDPPNLLLQVPLLNNRVLKTITDISLLTDLEPQSYEQYFEQSLTHIHCKIYSKNLAYSGYIRIHVLFNLNHPNIRGLSYQFKGAIDKSMWATWKSTVGEI